MNNNDNNNDGADFEVQTNHQIPAKRPVQELINKKKKEIATKEAK